MRKSGQLSERKAAILRDLVHLYIRTGEPVGSEALAAFSRLGVSSATIRNELGALEEMGYLTQPHTSAGRTPTDHGYRYFVNMLPARSRLRDPERLAIVHFFDEALADVDEILRGTTRLLSSLTRYASLAMALRIPLRTKFTATFVTQAFGDSIRSPRSDRSHARARASCTASSAAGWLPEINPTAPTSRG